MVDRFITRRWLFRGLLFGLAIGCWLSFVPSSKADGPVLVPPAPPAVYSPAISVPNLIPEPDSEGPALPYPVDAPAVQLRTPALDESSIRTPLPILRTPDGAPGRSLASDRNTIMPDPNVLNESDDAEFVTVPSRKRRTGFLGQSPRLQGAETSVTQNAFPIRQTPTVDAPNNPFPAGDASNITNQPLLTPVPSIDSPTDITPGEFNQLIDRMVLSAVPSRHTDDGQWGGKKTITSGVDLGLKGLFLRAKRTTKEVDHGSWKKFEIKGKTEATPYSVMVTKLKMINDHQFQFSAEYKVPLATAAELRDFSRGIRLRSITVDGEAVVKLAVDCTVIFESVSSATSAEQRRIILYPFVNSAKLQLAEFNPTKSSRFKGFAGRELERDTQRIVEQALKKREPELVESLNNQFAEHGFQLPLNELLDTKWGRMLAGSSDLAAAK